mgnify:CR=1 FL=1
MSLLAIDAATWLHQMLRIRRFEERCAELYGAGKIRGFLHLCIGEEAIAAAAVPELIRHSPLTRREWQVLSLIHAGQSNEQIAEHLNVAPTTIKTHIRSLYQKLAITQRSEAVQLARSLLSKIQGE